MYYNHYPYPQYYQHSVYQPYPIYHPAYRQYPPVNVKTFTKSVKTFRLLMEEGSMLLDRLGDEGFDTKIMQAAQQGNKAEVDHLIKSIGLKVPVTTNYTPSGVTFELTEQPNPGNLLSCCSLTVHLKWGN